MSKKDYFINAKKQQKKINDLNNVTNLKNSVNNEIENLKKEKQDENYRNTRLLLTCGAELLVAIPFAFLYLPMFLILSISAATFATVGGVGIILNNYSFKKQHNQLNEQITQLENKENELKLDIVECQKAINAELNKNYDIKPVIQSKQAKQIVKEYNKNTEKELEMNN